MAYLSHQDVVVHGFERRQEFVLRHAYRSAPRRERQNAVPDYPPGSPLPRFREDIVHDRLEEKAHRALHLRAGLCTNQGVGDIWEDRSEPVADFAWDDRLGEEVRLVKQDSVRYHPGD